jgi:hypothetical protein
MPLCGYPLCIAQAVATQEYCPQMQGAETWGNGGQWAQRSTGTLGPSLENSAPKALTVRTCGGWWEHKDLKIPLRSLCRWILIHFLSYVFKCDIVPKTTNWVKEYIWRNGEERVQYLHYCKVEKYTVKKEGAFPKLYLVNCTSILGKKDSCLLLTPEKNGFNVYRFFYFKIKMKSSA